MKVPAVGFRLATGLIRQGLISLLGLMASIFIVRSVPTHAYAFYTIVLSAISGCAVVADSGSGLALLAVAGRFWGQAAEVRNVLQTVIRCIRVTWPFSILGFAVWETIALLRNGFPVSQVLFAIAVLGINSFIGLRTKLWETVLRLDERQPAIQWTQLIEVSLRLSLIGGLTFVSGMGAFSALGAITMGQLLTYLRLRYRSLKDVIVQSGETAVSEHFQEIRNLMLRQLPNSLFFAVQGQLSIGLLSLLSNAEHVADFGALSRFSAASGVIQAFASLYLVPRFARLTIDWRSQFWRSLLFVTGLAAAVPFLALLIPHLMLSLLGGAYENLGTELRLLAFADMANCILSVAWALLASRGNNYFTWLYIPTNILAQIAGILTLQVNTLVGVILLNYISSLTLILILALEYRRASKKILGRSQ